MAFFSPIRRRKTPTALAVLTLLAASATSAVYAQDATLKPVTVNERTAAAQADVSGFGDVPVRELPMSTTVLDAAQMQAAGIRHLADVTRADPSATDSYNSAGYWDFLTVRGYTLSNRYNYRREGLPISAETSIPLDNKDRIEILKGTSGIQSGTSAPGGLVNYVVKRPTDQDQRTVRVEFSERGSLLTAADLGGRFGNDAAFGYRFNVAHEELRPELHNANGDRDLVSLATDWRLTKDSVLAAEFEWSHKKQASQAAFSLLGSVLPPPADPRINLNNQPWALPVEFSALTGTVRFDQALSRDWRWSAQVGTQKLKTDDREAFPFGCSAEGNFDRYCSDGTYDIYDYRSEGERRHFNAGKVQVQGNITTGAVRHDLTFGMLRSLAIERYNPQLFNYAGTGNVQGTLVVPPSPGAVDVLGTRDERSTELFAYDTLSWNKWRGWLGLRNTHLQRKSENTDGTQSIDYAQSFTTPWVGVSYQLQGNTVVYASAGQGVESFVTPNKASYTNPGQALPAVKSKQVEVGLRGGDLKFDWSLAAFAVRHPAVTDDTVNYQIDGTDNHKGVEAQAHTTQGAWTLGAGVMFLHARRDGSTLTPAVNGMRPTNLPENTLRASAAYRVAAVPGLELDTRVVREGARTVTSDNTIMLPAWTRWDAGLTYRTKASSADLTFRVAVDNLADKSYWRESPTQFAHYYLYPGAPRTLRVSLQAAL